MLLALCGLAAAQPSAVRYKVGNFTASDSISITGVSGSLSGGALGFTRVNGAGTGVEFAVPTGTGLPVNQNSPAFKGTMTAAAMSADTGNGYVRLKPSGAVLVRSGGSGPYNEGLRIAASPNGYSAVFLGCTPDVETGACPWIAVSAPDSSFSISSATGDAITISKNGAVNILSTLGVTGNFAVNTNKFTVTASSGNVVSAGTIKTGAPAASAASAVKIGTLVEGTCTFNAGVYLTAELDGTPVKLATATCF